MNLSGTTHKRIYQACDNCRTKRVRCHLGSVDQPQDPPCARCKRENRRCVFSSTRKRRAKTGTNVADHNVNDDDPVRDSPDVERTDFDVSMHNVYSPQNPTERQPESFDGQQTISALLDHPIDTSNDALEVLHEAFQHSGTPVVDPLSSSSGKEQGRRHKHEADRNDNDHVLNAWSSLRFVQTGLLTAREALSYVTYFYTHLAPLSPVPTLRFKDPTQHHRLLEEEPILAITILMLSSRYMKLSGPGAVTRGDIIHDRLWIYLQVMITKVFWSEESFMSGDTPNPGNPQCSVLRTIGTCEALLLLLEWHPKNLHFPSADNDTNSIIVRHGNENRTHFLSAEGRYGRTRSGVDWMLRSDQYNERAQRIQQLLWVFSVQVSGRLGWKYPLTSESIRRSISTSLDGSTSCWVGIASLLQKGHELLFFTPKQIDDLVSEREYGPLLRILLTLLEDWRRGFESSNLSKPMRWILAVEYEYVRVYVYSIVLRAVIERRRKEKNSSGDQITRLEGQREDTDALYDGLYLGYLTDAARSLLRVAVHEIFPDGCLLNVPVRTYFRILTAAVYLLKTCAIEVEDKEIQKSVELVIHTAVALQSSVVDDVHLSPHWGKLLAGLCSSLRTRATQTVTPRSDLEMQQQRIPTNYVSETVTDNQPIPQSGFIPQSKPSGNPSQSLSPPLSNQPGTLNPASYTQSYSYDFGTVPPALNADQSLTYDELFSWTDPMSGMDITQMPWNGDQAIFDILSSGMGPENE